MMITTAAPVPISSKQYQSIYCQSQNTRALFQNKTELKTRICRLIHSPLQAMRVYNFKEIKQNYINRRWCDRAREREGERRREKERKRERGGLHTPNRSLINSFHISNEKVCVDDRSAAKRRERKRGEINRIQQEQTFRFRLLVCVILFVFFFFYISTIDMYGIRIRRSNRLALLAIYEFN